MTGAPEAIPLTVRQLVEQLRACPPDAIAVNAAGDPLILVVTTGEHVALLGVQESRVRAIRADPPT